MNQPLPLDPQPGFLARNLPLLHLLNPGRLTPWVLLSLLAGVGMGYVVHVLWELPLWVITLIVLLGLLPVGIVKWRADKRRWGWVVMLISILLVTQGTHTIEHLVQWVEYHVLFWTPRQSNGLLSPANSEWVHFVWNWGVLICVSILIFKGKVHSFFSYLLLTIAAGHTLEHTYMFFRHISLLNELQVLCVTGVGAQGLPGIFGRDGWLARSAVTYGTPVSSLPGLTTAIRLDVHFWWNAIEMTLLMLAAHFYLRGVFNPRPQKPAAQPISTAQPLTAVKPS